MNKSVKKKPQVVKEVPTVEKKVEGAEKEVERFKEADVALLVPFKLNHIDLNTATKQEVEKSAMAIDFYQGFKLGLDSAVLGKLNVRLHVFDTQDNDSRIGNLTQLGSISDAELIVGPVFPSGLKSISAYSVANHIPVINPLAASHPGEFNNPNLISITNNIDLHAAKVAAFIAAHYDPKKAVIALISTKSDDDEMLAKPVRKYLLKSGKPYVVEEYSSVFTMETKMQKGKKYVVIVSSSDRKFVLPTIDKLIKMKRAGLDFDLFGHPDWVRQNYNVDKLQELRVTITSSYKVDYTRSAAKNFIKAYRSAFHFEPSEYAFKGFDIGLYFGGLIVRHGKDYLRYLTKEEYKGLHNNFSFVYDKNAGFINTSLMVLRYQNFALNRIE